MRPNRVHEQSHQPCTTSDDRAFHLQAAGHPRIAQPLPRRVDGFCLLTGVRHPFCLDFLASYTVGAKNLAPPPLLDPILTLSSHATANGTWCTPSDWQEGAPSIDVHLVAVGCQCGASSRNQSILVLLAFGSSSTSTTRLVPPRHPTTMTSMPSIPPTS
jgi:hypothetical protein